MAVEGSGLVADAASAPAAMQHTDAPAQRTALMHLTVGRRRVTVTLAGDCTVSRAPLAITESTQKRLTPHPAVSCQEERDSKQSGRRDF
jgi:hypothetical protein